MSNRLEEIKETYKRGYKLDSNAFEKSTLNLDFEWLIQQAERTEVLEGDRDSLEVKISQAYIEIKRYKQVLEFATSELYHAFITGDIADKENTIKKVMEKIDEALEEKERPEES